MDDSDMVTLLGGVRQHEGYRAGEAGYRRVSVALFAAGVATFALLYSTQALLPELAEAFSVSAAESTLSLSLATIGLAVALLVAGPLSEAVGRTRLIHFSVTVSAFVALACAFAPDWRVLLGLRLVQGVTIAGLPAVATAYLREELHAGAHSRAAGLYIGGNALGGMIGRLVTGRSRTWRAGGGRSSASPWSDWVAPSSYACCCPRRATSSRNPRA